MPAKPRKATSNRNTIAKRNGQRNASGQYLPGSGGQGFSTPGSVDLFRARKTLNLLTIEAMTDAFRRGGREAINKVMRNAPAQFLKMAVLLVPRELEVTHSGGVKGMSDEQLERGIQALELILAKRAAQPGDDAKLIEGAASPGTPTGAGGADTPSATES
jgi:hypothetical protein